VTEHHDFTESEYASLVELAAAHYRFVGFDALDEEPPVVLWRHDVDYSPQRARSLASIEAERGVSATYFLNPHSDFYNLLEPAVLDAVRGILELGHWLGLHFDPGAVASIQGDRDEWLARERRLLEDLFGASVTAYSTHNPTLVDGLDRRDTAEGMTNAYGTSLHERFEYCSDSNGLWRFRSLREVLEGRAHDRLHVLTHPGWWVPEPMAPRARISRAIDGRAAAQHARYDELLESAGRPNVR
jgi:hypothetical protein